MSEENILDNTFCENGLKRDKSETNGCAYGLQIGNKN
jgi:hypothetical protein